MPGDGAMFNPVAGDGALIDDLQIARVPGGYDAIRAIVFDLYDRYTDFEPETLAATSATPPGSFEYVYAFAQSADATKRHHKHRAH